MYIEYYLIDNQMVCQIDCLSLVNDDPFIEFAVNLLSMEIYISEKLPARTSVVL